MGQKIRIFGTSIEKTNLLSDDIIYNFSGDKEKNFTLYHPDIIKQLVKVIPPSKWDFFMEYSQRKHYPAEFKNFSNYELSLLTMYFVCEFSFNNRDYSIIEVPAAENKNLPPGSKPETDIYFVSNYYGLMDESGMSNKQKNKESHYQKLVKLKTEFNAAKKLMEGKYVDSTLFFRTILSLPIRPQEYYAQKYQDVLKADDVRQKAELDAYHKKKNQEEAEKQARIQKKQDEIANYTQQLMALNKPLLEAYQSGNIKELLTHYRYWSGTPIDIDDEMPRVSGQLNDPPHYTYHQKSRFEFISKLGSFDLICNTNLRCMITSQAYNTRQENFIITETFVPTKDSKIFVNEKFGSDGVYTNEQFYKEPWNYFAKYFKENVNEVVASEFKIMVVNDIVTLYFKSKQFDNGRYFWPEDMYELLAKIKYAKETISKIESE